MHITPRSGSRTGVVVRPGPARTLLGAVLPALLVVAAPSSAPQVQAQEARGDREARRALAVQPFGERYGGTVYGDFRTVGGTVLRGDGSSRRRVSTATGLTGTFDSGTATVTVPPGARVTYARLYWGGSTGTYGTDSGGALRRCARTGPDADPAPGDPLSARPVISVADGAQREVAAQSTAEDPPSATGPHVYTAEGEVTDAFADVPTGRPVTVSVGNVWAPGGRGCTGGWSLTLVHAYDGPNERYAPTRRDVRILGGHARQHAAAPPTTVRVGGFHSAGRQPVRVSATAYGGPGPEGDVPADGLRVNGRAATPPGAGGASGTSGTAVAGDDGSDRHDGFAVRSADLPYGAVPQGTRSAALSFRTGSTGSTGSTGAGNHVASQLALSVPVPDLVLRQTARPRHPRAGDKVTFTVTAENAGPLPRADARFSVGLSGVLDDAAYHYDAVASRGTAALRGTDLAWNGALPPGGRATVTWSATVRPGTGASAGAANGDGRLRGGVRTGVPRANCGPGSTDPACTFDSRIAAPAASAAPSSPYPPDSGTGTGTGTDAETGAGSAAGPGSGSGTGLLPAVGRSRPWELSAEDGDDRRRWFTGGLASILCGLGCLLAWTVRRNR